MANQVFLIIILTLLFLNGCSRFVTHSDPIPLFGERQVLGIIELDSLNEISGLSASQRQQDILWVHNDSGDGSNIYAITITGKHVATFSIKGCWAFDWEDIAIGPGPEKGVSYLYIGDIGDNRSLRPFIQVCRVPEPDVMGAEPSLQLQGEVITLQYPNGPRDAEALMIAPLSKDIVVISKREKNVFVYYAQYPYKLSEPVQMHEITRLPISKVTAADITYDGREVLIMTTRQVLLWQRGAASESLRSMFDSQPVVVSSYRRDLQDEAIGWAKNAKGFYTTSEELLGISAKINYYPRLEVNK